MKQYAYVGVILLGFLILGGCSDTSNNNTTNDININAAGDAAKTTRKEKSSIPDPSYTNLINAFALSEKLLPHQTINLKSFDTRQLEKGWHHISDPEQARWAKGLKSDLTFLSPIKADMDLIISCRPFMPGKTPQQTIKISLNGDYLLELPLKPSKHQYHVSLPSDSVTTGKNKLRFQYKYAEKPSDHTDSNDDRKLSVAFDEIRLKTPSIPDHSAILQKNEDQILQSPHTVMNYYYRVPAGSNLEVAAAPLKNPVTGKILISSGDKETKRIDLAVKKNDSASKKISLEPFAGQIVKFSFCIADDASQPQTPTESTLKNGVLWSKLKIDKAENDLDEQTPTKTAPLNKFKKSIRNLDVIYIVFDAFNAKHSNIYGYNRDTTPFLAQLSKRGIVFDHFFANQPYTLASTATLLTSTYCDEHGLIRHQNRLSPVVQTLPEILSDHDVASYLITGHTYFKETWGLQRGFTDVFFDLKYNNQANEIRNALETIYQSANDQTAQKFIYLHLMPPHAPYEPPEKYQTFHQENHTPISVSSETLQKIQDKEIEASQSQLEHIKAMYDANILFADAIAQKIVDFLESRQLKEKTIIFFTSDHGEAFMEHGFTTHNDSIYDDMLHIPFIISTPEKIQTERKNIPNIASIVDIKPTLLDIFNIRATDRLKGTSLLPTLFEESAKGHMDHIYLETLARTGQIGIRDLNYKLIIAPDGNELFDLQKDPAEQNNCFNERPLIAGYYLQKLKRYQDQNERAGTGGDVNIENLDEKTLNQLKELGYIK